MKAVKSQPEPDTVATVVVDSPPPKTANVAIPEALPAIPPPVPPADVTVLAAPADKPDFRFYKTIAANMPLYVDKVRIRFEILDRNMGVIRLNPATDARSIEVLDKLVKAKIGGVGAIDEQTYTDLKKNRPLNLSAPRSLQPKLKIWDNLQKRKLSSQGENAGAAAAVDVPAIGSREPAVAVVGDTAKASKSPASFTPNLQRKSGKMKLPHSGQFRPEAFRQPPPIGR